MEQEAGVSALWGSRFTRFDAAAAPPRERFEYWRTLFPLLEVRPLRPASTYRSVAVSCAGDDGTVFSRVRADPTVAHFTEGRDQRVLLSLLLRGAAHVRHGRRHHDAAPRGHFTLLDCTRTARTSHFGHSLHLSFPRARVARLLGPAFSGNDASFRQLPATPLSEVLKASLVALGRHGMDLDQHAAPRAVEAVGELAMAYLAQLKPQPAQPSSPAEQARFEAACLLMEARLANPGLTATGLAAAVGCSRAQLYRLFAQRGLSVSTYLREIRLLRGRALLREPEPAIAEVAVSCGYGDLPAFGKAFRRRFGMSPGEWRRMTMRAGVHAAPG